MRAPPGAASESPAYCGAGGFSPCGVRTGAARLLRPWTGDRRDRWMISFSAGVGEELLFRGALQYWLGIPLTAIAFVALHGYLNPRDARVSVYGSYLVLCMFVYGLVAQHLGLLPAVIAHVLFDVVLLHRLNRHGSPVDE